MAQEGGRLTKAQRALLEKIAGGAVLINSRPPGAVGSGKWYVEKPYSDEDGRTAWSIYERGYTRHEGDGLYTITPAGREALQQETTDER